MTMTTFALTNKHLDLHSVVRYPLLFWQELLKISKSGGVIRTAKLSEIAKDSKVKIHNEFPLDDNWEVSKMICLSMMGEKETNYHALEFNCEHFANFVRSGKKVSTQVLAIGAQLEEFGKILRERKIRE